MRPAVLAALLCAAALACGGSAAAAPSGADGVRAGTARAHCKQKQRAARRRCIRLRRCLRRAHGSRRKRAACRRRHAPRRLAPPAPPRGPVTTPPADPPPADPPAAPDPPLVPPALGRFVSVASREYSLTLSRPVVAAGEVAVELRNPGEDPHDLVISPDDGSHAPLAGFGETASGGMLRKTVPLPAGRYLLWCSLEGHEALGMRAVLRAE
ncbi:MAG TPA: hypothetical protein VGF25_19550 [Thermoleophilaceae bacterium]|jgi:hypothetical protein